MNSVTENKHDGDKMAATETGAGADVIDVLRRFHHGDPAAAESTDRPDGTILPALLNPYRDASAIRYQYPLYLGPPDGVSVIAKPMSEHLADELEALAAGAEDARILKDNLPWLERYLRQKLG